MESLPIEMVERILSYLDLETLEVVDSVCVTWSNIISMNHFHPYLAAQEYSIRKYLTRNDWTPSCSDIGLITKLFKKVRQRSTPGSWVSSRPTVRTKILVDKKYDVNEYGDTKTMVYMDKLYLSRCDGGMYGKVEVYSLETIDMMYNLETGEDEVKEEIAYMRRHDRVGAVCFGRSRRSFDKIWLYDLQTDELVGQIETTEPFRCFVMNKTMLVCLFDSSCRSWMINSSLPGKVESHSKEVFSSPTEEAEIIRVTINSEWLVTLVDETASLTFQVRQLGPGAKMGQIRKLECVAFTSDKYVGQILLNDKNLMAVPNYLMAVPTQFDVLVINTGTDTVVSHFSVTTFATDISWKDNWLFVKRFGYHRYKEERLGTWWNVWTGEEDGIDAVLDESWTDQPFSTRVEVEAARYTEVLTSHEGITKIMVYDFWNVPDIDAHAAGEEMSP